MGRCLDIGADWELVEGIREGLETLTGNMGIDLTDSPFQIRPYATAVAVTGRLIISVVRTKREFKAKQTVGLGTRSRSCRRLH